MNTLKAFFLLHVFFSLQSNLLAQVITDKTIGTITNFEDNCDLVAYGDGYILAKTTDAMINGNVDTANYYLQSAIWLLNLDHDLNITQSRLLGGNRSDGTPNHGKVIVDSNNFIYVINSSSSDAYTGTINTSKYGKYDYWITKLDSSLNIIWTKCYGGNGDDFVSTALLNQANNSIIVAGSFEYKGNLGSRTIPLATTEEDIYIIEISTADGSIIKEANINARISGIEDFFFLENGNIMTTVTSAEKDTLDKTHPGFGGADGWFLYLDQNFNIVQQATIGGTLNDFAIKSIKIGNHFYSLFSSYSDIGGLKNTENYGADDYWLVCLDEDFNVLWEKTLGGSNSDWPKDMMYNPERNVIYLFGDSSSDTTIGNRTEPLLGNKDFWMIEVNLNGDIVNQHALGGYNSELSSGMVRNGDNLILYGKSNSNIGLDKSEMSKGGFDSWILKMDVLLSTENLTSVKATQVFPNPAANQFSLINIAQPTHYQITDITGKIIKQGIYHPNTSIDIAVLTKGLYLVKIEGYELQELVVL